MSKKANIRRKKKIVGTAQKPRLVVFRSVKHIYGQIIDDVSQQTLIGASNLTKELAKDLKKAKNRVEASTIIGEYLAKKAKEKKIENVVFDRNGYRYHGRVKALADGARKGGLVF
ncbi:MAG: 50S ribosomal protein L18 [Calditrichia bacterium]